MPVCSSKRAMAQQLLPVIFPILESSKIGPSALSPHPAGSQPISRAMTQPTFDRDDSKSQQIGSS